MTEAMPVDAGAAKDFIVQALALYAKGSNEEVLKQNLVSHLSRMFPSAPLWVDHHARGAEAMVAYKSEGLARRGFIDNLVGYTTIEYEHDLNNRGVFKIGFKQVHQHLAGLLNAGVPANRLIGILSDTLRWRAYRVREFTTDGLSSQIDPADLTLDEVESLDITAATDLEAEKLTRFLVRYVGREASLPLSAGTLADDLGFDSTFCIPHLEALRPLVDGALDERPDYGAIIERLWSDFVSYLGDGTGPGRFDREVYVSELYLVTFAKLICANVIAREGLHSDRSQLKDILNGGYFKSKGLVNLVEYDYFGWLNAPPYIDVLLGIAENIQRDLRAYDFENPSPHDFFGKMLSQLAKRSQRLLLGQEWTPEWLAAKIAQRLVGALPTGEPPRFIDMCCGSGSFLVAVVKLVGAGLTSDTVQEEAARAELVQVATGFDIDPLAVLLAKVNWVVAARDWLGPFDGSHPTTIPVYLADSLFGKTPLGDVAGSGDVFELMLHDRVVSLPKFLVTPKYRHLFDAILEYGYSLAMASAAQSCHADVPAADLQAALDEAVLDSQATVPDESAASVSMFFAQLVKALDELQGLGLNGIWSFVLRNSYRPALVLGQFNGVISNPPWLALSKVANNPYKARLRLSAEAYAIKPPGPSHLHIELATTFLLHAIDQYLQDGAVVGCVLPETVLNGYQHTPFRRGKYRRSARKVKFGVTEGWRVETATFKNEAIVLFGKKGAVTPTAGFPGRLERVDGHDPLQFRVLTLGDDRVIWSDNSGAEDGAWFDDIQLRQGADVMPRTAIFFETAPIGNPTEDRWRIASIDRSTSRLAYLVNEGKKLTDFRVTPRAVPGRYLFDVLLSKHLVPFVLGEPARGFLPIERNMSGVWQPVSSTRLAATPGAKDAFEEIFAALGPSVGVDEYFASINSDRRKLSAQWFGESGYLVVFGAGGTYACSAFAPMSRLNSNRLIIDQTLYWTVVDSEDEALYISGLFNSDGLDLLIRQFQPQGRFGRRHVHELPVKVTPGFNPSLASHMAVVDATRALLDEVELVRTKPKFSKIFDPARGLSGRRRAMRSEVLTPLLSYAEYDAACRELYGLD